MQKQDKINTWLSLYTKIHKTVVQTEQQNTSEAFNPQNRGLKPYSTIKVFAFVLSLVTGLFYPLKVETGGAEKGRTDGKERQLTTPFIWIIYAFAFCSFQSASK